MKKDDCILDDNDQHNASLFSFSTNKFVSFFCFQNACRRKFCWEITNTIQKNYKSRKKKNKKTKKNLANILPLQSNSPKRGLPFPSPIYYSFSSKRSSSISKFEKAFEAIRKNEKDYKETLRSYNFRKPKRKADSSEQVNLISIFDF